MSDPHISVVVPAHNEGLVLPRLLASLQSARDAHVNGPAAVEVIVADNASTDDTAAVAAAHGCRVAPVEKRCIGAARNGGAAIAKGRVLAFVDADTVVHAFTFDAVQAALADARVVGGATGVTLDRWSVGLALTYAMMVPMVWATGMDTGVVFCRREDFEALGGYDESRLVAEDVDFLWRLRRLGARRGQRLRRLRHCKAVASTRKFDRHGDWHYFTQMPTVGWNALRGRDTLTEFAKRYWYGDR